MLIKTKKQLIIISICFLFALVLVYRGFLITRYCTEFTDDDQALMWDGAVAFSRFFFPEPCFWGQSYGSMFESMVAVPLLWLRIPVRNAMPVSMFLISFFPFGLACVSLLKKNRPYQAVFSLALYLLLGWRWDILTSVPRNLISGFPFAIAGVILMNSKNKVCTGFGAFLVCLGVVHTTTTVMVAVLGLAAYLWQNRKIRRLLPLLPGFGYGGLVFLLHKDFYHIHQDYALHPAYSFQLSREVWLFNMKRIPLLMEDYIFTGTGYVIIAGTFLLLVILCLKKRWLTVLMVILNWMCLIGLLAMEKTMDYGTNTVLYSQTRMLLGWAYGWLAVLYLDAVSHGESRQEYKIPGMIIVGILCILVPISIISKTGTVKTQISSPESELNNGDQCRLYGTQDMIREARKTDEFAETHDIDVIVIRNDCRAFSYLFEALYFRKYIVYNIVYDRRTWVYRHLCKAQPYRCLFVDYAPGNSTFEIIELEDISVPNYIRKKFHIIRNPYPDYKRWRGNLIEGAYAARD